MVLKKVPQGIIPFYILNYTLSTLSLNPQARLWMVGWIEVWLCKVLVKLDVHFSSHFSRMCLHRQGDLLHICTNLYSKQAFLYSTQLFKHLAMIISPCSSPDCQYSNMTEFLVLFLWKGLIESIMAVQIGLNKAYKSL